MRREMTCAQCGKPTYEINPKRQETFCEHCDDERHRKAREAYEKHIGSGPDLPSVQATEDAVRTMWRDFDWVRQSVEAQGKIVRALVSQLTPEQKSAVEEKIGDRLDRVLRAIR